MKDFVYKDTNAVITVDVMEDISTAERAIIRYIRPNAARTRGEWVAALSGLCTVVAMTGNSLTDCGIWNFQAKVWLADGRVVRSDIGTFEVLPVI